MISKIPYSYSGSRVLCSRFNNVLRDTNFATVADILLDYSGASATTFEFVAPPTPFLGTPAVYAIYRLQFSLQFNGPITTMANFGDLAAPLTNGMQVIVNGQNLLGSFPILSNADYSKVGETRIDTNASITSLITTVNFETPVLLYSDAPTPGTISVDVDDNFSTGNLISNNISIYGIQGFSNQ